MNTAKTLPLVSALFLGLTAFDGRYIGVPNNSQKSVSILSAKNGTYVGTIQVEPQPKGVCFLFQTCRAEKTKYEKIILYEKHSTF
jgi:hypothetical protein